MLVLLALVVVRSTVTSSVCSVVSVSISSVNVSHFSTLRVFVSVSGVSVSVT